MRKALIPAAFAAHAIVHVVLPPVDIMFHLILVIAIILGVKSSWR